MTVDPAPLPSLLSLVTDDLPLLEESPPEALLISALLESGSYNPRSYGVLPEAIRAHRPVHEWCLNYQEHAGSAPPVHLVTSKFPGFVYVPSVSPAWAAHQVQSAETNRTLRKALAKAAIAINDEAHNEAVGILRTAVTSLTSANRPGTLMTDFSRLRAAATAQSCPIPPGVLSGLTGGHGAGQLWLTAALWGVGKTWDLLDHAVAAAEAGWPVVIFSMEQSVEEMLDRLHTVALRHLATPAQLLDLDDRERAILEWSEQVASVEVRGPMDGRVDASVVAGAVEKGEQKLVVLDYIGKMFTLDGHYAGEDHIMQKNVSNELKFTAAEMGVPILAAAQLNRVGQLGGSIALEQDADLILEISRVSEDVNSIRKKRLVKSRHTALVAPWYSRFDALTGHFGDLTREQAYELRSNEERLL